MNYTIRYDLEVIQDINDAAEWYNKKSPGLGERFKNQVIEQVDSLGFSGAAHRIRYKDIRCVVIKDFPFMIHYKLTMKNKLIEIFAVFHTSRNPKIWKSS